MEQYTPLISRDVCELTVSNASDTSDSITLNELPLIDLEKETPKPLLRQRVRKWVKIQAHDIVSPQSLSRHAWQTLCYLASTILPRFLTRTGWKKEQTPASTAWLDALRGWAALSVYFFHTYFDTTHDTNQYWLDTPFVAGLINGRAMVQVFFVISGFAVSSRILKTMNTQPGGPRVLQALASSTFRRWFRLYASSGLATLIAATMVYLGLMDGKLKSETLLGQVWDWSCDLAHFVNPFVNINGWWGSGSSASASKYLGILWTIPAEFRGSIAVFWFLTASTQLSKRSRRYFAGLVIVLCYAWGVMFAACFLQGMLLADLNMDQQQGPSLRLENLEPPLAAVILRNDKRWQISRAIAYGCLAAVSIYLLGQPPPEHNVRDFPWDLLHSLIPRWWADPDGNQGEEFWYVLILRTIP
jgi:peptidoglycan/LPS O-acetylase OafA/YrhL